MKRRHGPAGLRCMAALAVALMLATLACGLSSGQTSTPLPTASAATVSATSPPTPIQTYVLPSITPSPTSTLAFATPKEQRLNCRYGPGTVYAIVGAVEVGQSAQIAAQSEGGAWWNIHDPGNPGGFCWVLAELTDTSGNLSGVPVLPPPAVSVSKIEMSVDPPHRSVTCNAFPQTFYITAEITVNGPAIVTWRWEVNSGEVSPDGTLTFSESGTQTIEYYYLTPSANDYVVRMHVLGPNEAFEEVVFRVDCTP